MIYKSIDASELGIDERELAVRLSSPNTRSVLNSVHYDKLLKASSPAYVAERVSITVAQNGIFIGGIYTESKAIMKALKDSDECFIMVCTLGLGVDKLIAKEALTSVYDAFVIDAMADAAIEAACDFAERDMCGGCEILPRFSPGYADLPLTIGCEIVRLLRADTHLGIRFTDSGMMIPGKSVSAIVGIKRPEKE